MELNEIIISLVIIAVPALIAFLIIQNQKDKKDFMRQLVQDDEDLFYKDQVYEVDPTLK